MVDGGGVPFSVVYYDGDSEATVGEFTVDHSFNFNKFLSFLSHKIGISPHQFSVYLATFGTNRKIPVTAKLNVVAAVAGAGGGTFYVKRSKRPRRNKARSKGSRNAGNDPPENAVLLRRDAAVPFNAMVPVPGRVEYEKRVREFQMERERFMMKMGIGDLCLGREPAIAGGVFCEGCSAGSDGGFHWCVYDEVTVGFRSPAGPVARPFRRSG